MGKDCLNTRFPTAVIKMFWKEITVMVAQLYEHTKPTELYTLISA